MLREKFRLMACTDCLLYVTDGAGGEERGRRIHEHMGESIQFLVYPPGDGSQDDEFSWLPCEACGSREGGARYELVMLEPVAESVNEPGKESTPARLLTSLVVLACALLVDGCSLTVLSHVWRAVH